MFWSAWRLLAALPSLNQYFDKSGGGKVISAFYFLIFITSTFRCIWFLIPTDVLEGSYTPIPKYAYTSRKWVGVFTSEVLLALGSMSLYAIFILIASFWAHMLQRVDSVDEVSIPLRGSEEPSPEDKEAKKRGPLLKFALMMAVLLFMEGSNLVLFLLQAYDSDGMILYDSILISLISLATLIEFTIFSSRIQHALRTISAVNAASTTVQRNRILSITIAANTFFVIHFVVEATLAVSLLLAWHHGLSFSTVLGQVTWWELYLRVKHWTEVAILAMALMVSVSGHTSHSGDLADYEQIPDSMHLRM